MKSRNEKEICLSFLASASPKELGEMLKMARLHIGKTPVDIAYSMRTGEGAVWRLEAGKTNATLATVRKYAEALGFEAQIQLVHRSPDEP